MTSGLFTVNPERPLPSHTSLLCLTDSFNNDFTTKIAKLRDNLAEINNTSLSVLVSSTFSSFTQVPVSYIQELIAKSKPKSYALVPVPIAILKQAQEVLVGPLTDIINASLQTGVFPTVLKKEVAHPSLKKSRRDYEQYSSYQYLPTTNIAFLSKTIERIAATQTMNYLFDNDLLPKFQSAYRPHHSTKTALAYIFNDILKAIL